MGFPPSPTFNPTVSKVPTLGPSSGDPKSKNDPKSIASIGANIQAMQDQANADRLYDAPVTQVSEGFDDYNVMKYTPWIVKSQACRRVQGFADMAEYRPVSNVPYVEILAGLGVVFILASFVCKE
jgi:hypothetical protein